MGLRNTLQDLLSKTENKADNIIESFEYDIIWCACVPFLAPAHCSLDFHITVSIADADLWLTCDG